MKYGLRHGACWYYSLLIEPQGIEISINNLDLIRQFAFNRTTRNWNTMKQLNPDSDFRLLIEPQGIEIPCGWLRWLGCQPFNRTTRNWNTWIYMAGERWESFNRTTRNWNPAPASLSSNLSTFNRTTRNWNHIIYHYC